MFTWYQSFVFSALEGRVIKGTQYWSETNIADGLNALTICIEMIFFAALMWWAYTPAAYRVPGARPTSIWRPLWDSINISDFALEIWQSLKFFVDYMRGVPETHGQLATKPDFAQAFGISSGRANYIKHGADGGSSSRATPYSYGEEGRAHSSSEPNSATPEGSYGRV